MLPLVVLLLLRHNDNDVEDDGLTELVLTFVVMTGQLSWLA